jgi:lysosomal alpha-mannosidase
MKVIVALLLPFFVGLAVAVPLNVHVVAHSHDDVGWLKTVDQYYYTEVQYIIDTVVTELQQNPARKFIYVEVAYFFRWWREQTPETQAIVKSLVKSGQLEFINGGWTMHDEACVHFEDMIDQLTLGHQFLKNNFGILPKIGWQIDPFGHSSTNAIIDNLAGFEGIFFARMDFQDLQNRMNNKALEMNWYPSMSLPNMSILTGYMYGGYCTPGVCLWDAGAAPVQDDPLLEDYNLDNIAQRFLSFVQQQAADMRHNDIMLAWGCDFMFQNAHLMFKNMDKLMNHINANPSFNLKMFYSTPSMYAEAIKASGVTLPTNNYDFFPYADNSHSYWSGYFVSRPTLKGFVRYSSHILHAVSSLLAASQIQSSALQDQLFVVQQPGGVTTHHDAVTGTERDPVADDYALNLNIANANAFSMFSQIYGTLIASKAPPTFSFCPLLNESICPATQVNSGNIPVVVYNPLAWTVSDYVNIPINVGKANVVDSNNNPVAAQVLAGKTANSYYVVFPATVPGLGFTTYFVMVGASSENSEISSVETPLAGFTLSNKYLTVNLDIHGDIQSVVLAGTGQTVTLSQEYQYYVSNTGDSASPQPSGAYVFRPAQQQSFPFNTTSPQVQFVSGSLVQEVRRYFQPDLSQVIRLYANQPYIEIEDTVGPIDISDHMGKEVVTRYTTNLATGNIWYSDSNGIELQQRKLNYRPTWNYTVSEPVAGNFVPVDAITSMNDLAQKLQLTVVVDRSRSSASLRAGELETMLHRRCLKDDNRGVAEALNDSTVMTSKEWIVVSNITGAASIYRPLAKKAYHPFVLAFGPSTPYTTWKNQYKTDFAPLGLTVPPNVQILNFVPIGEGNYILRLHHIFQVGEDATLAQPVTVDISALLAGYAIITVQETQLTGVAPAQRSDAIRIDDVAALAAIPVLLRPTEIRTFVITLKPATAFTHAANVQFN